MKIYPAIDLIGGKVVRLTQGRFDAVTEYDTDPSQVARRFARAGATYLHVVDLDGARDGSVRQAEVIGRIIRETAMAVQVGGGIRTIAQATAYLDAGAERVVIGSLAVRDRAAAEALCAAVGAERVTLAVDFHRDPSGQTRVAVQGWKESSAMPVEELIGHYAKRGVKTVLCTDVSRDGTLAGPDTDRYRAWQEQFAAIEIQVSGGIGSLEHLEALRLAQARAAILGKSLYEGKVKLEEALRC
jgi:phosphoribosylformimino-5-aminoimidazole carboxamide ribotide isomerase